MAAMDRNTAVTKQHQRVLYCLASSKDLDFQRTLHFPFICLQTTDSKQSSALLMKRWVKI